MSTEKKKKVSSEKEEKKKAATPKKKNKEDGEKKKPNNEPNATKLYAVLRAMEIDIGETKFTTQMANQPDQLARLHKEISQLQPAAKKSSPMRNMYKYDVRRKQVQRLFSASHPNIRIPETSVELKQLTDKEALRELVADMDEVGEDEVDRTASNAALLYRLFEEEGVARRQDMLAPCTVEQAFWADEATQECWPLTSSQGKKLLGAYVLIKASDNRKYAAVATQECEALWKKRENALAILSGSAPVEKEGTDEAEDQEDNDLKKKKKVTKSIAVAAAEKPKKAKKPPTDIDSVVKSKVAVPSQKKKKTVLDDDDDDSGASDDDKKKKKKAVDAKKVKKEVAKKKAKKYESSEEETSEESFSTSEEEEEEEEEDEESSEEEEEESSASSSSSSEKMQVEKPKKKKKVVTAVPEKKKKKKEESPPPPKKASPPPPPQEEKKKISKKTQKELDDESPPPGGRSKKTKRDDKEMQPDDAKSKKKKSEPAKKVKFSEAPKPVEDVVPPSKKPVTTDTKAATTKVTHAECTAPLITTPTAEMRAKYIAMDKWYESELKRVNSTS